MKLLCFLAVSLCAQTTGIIPGSAFFAPIKVLPGSPACQGTLYNAPPLPVMQYGVTMICDIALPNGLYSIAVEMEDPRSTTTAPPAAVGQRIFQITANGVPSMPLDLIALRGAQTPYTQFLYVPVGSGALHLVFQAIKGNAIWNSITITGLGVTINASATGSLAAALWLALPATAPTTTPSAPLQ